MFHPPVIVKLLFENKEFPLQVLNHILNSQEKKAKKLTPDIGFQIRGCLFFK